MKVSILHYSNSIIDLNKPFGMQIMELNEVRELRKNKIEATLFAKDVIGEHPHINKVPYSEYDKTLFDLPFYTRFIDANKDADIIQGNATPLLAVFNPNKTILRFDGPVDLQLVENTSIREAYQNTNFIFVSKYLKTYYLNRYPFIPENNCHVLYNAVDQFGTPLKPANKKLKMLFCSRWIYDKGISVLIEALKILEKNRNDYEVTVAGGIHRTKNDSADNAAEKKIKEKLKLLKNVNIVGYVPHSKLMTLLLETDILLFPSLWDEPFGLLPAEAAMASTPTIAFSVGALPEVVIHNETGVLIKKSKYDFINARRLSNEIYKCLDNPMFIRELGNNARTRCVNEFNWHIYMQTLLKIYKNITDNNE